MAEEPRDGQPASGRDPRSLAESAPEDAAAQDAAPGASKALEMLALAFVFPLTIYVGFLAGRWIGAYLGASGPGALVGGILGAVGGFLELYGFARRLGPR
jgi:hypothetical protein